MRVNLAAPEEDVESEPSGNRDSSGHRLISVDPREKPERERRSRERNEQTAGNAKAAARHPASQDRQCQARGGGEDQPRDRADRHELPEGAGKGDGPGHDRENEDGYMGRPVTRMDRRERPRKLTRSREGVEDSRADEHERARAAQSREHRSQRNDSRARGS